MFKDTLSKFLFKFPTSRSKPGIDPSGRQLGPVILERTDTINSYVDAIIKGIEIPFNNNESEGSSWVDLSQKFYYFRAPTGSGKSTLLFLLGKKFQSLNDYLVYHFPVGDYLKEITFAKLKNKLQQKKKIVLLIDHFQKDFNPTLIAELCNTDDDNVDNVILIAVGTFAVGDFALSPSFQFRYESRYIMFKVTELKELKDYWKMKIMELNHLSSYIEGQEYKEINEIWTPDQIDEIVEWLFSFTRGQIYPLLALSEYFFEKFPYQMVDWEDHFLSDFIKNEVFRQILKRNFPYLSEDFELSLIISKVLNSIIQPDELAWLSKGGYWNYGQGWFLSPLLLVMLLNEAFQSVHALTFKDFKDLELSQKIDVIIEAGLVSMTSQDFKEPGRFNDVFKMPNACGFCWAYQVRRNLPFLYISPQTQTIITIMRKSGKQAPTLDFTFDDRLVNVGIEIYRNAYWYLEDILRLKISSDEWSGRSAILNFQLEEIKDLKLELPDNDQIYSFYLPNNILYKGKKELIVGACDSLYTPSLQKTGAKQDVNSPLKSDGLTLLLEIMSDMKDTDEVQEDLVNQKDSLESSEKTIGKRCQIFQISGATKAQKLEPSTDLARNDESDEDK